LSIFSGLYQKDYLEENTQINEDLVVDMAEYKRLIRENRVLKEERDILKKAIGYFSQNNGK